MQQITTPANGRELSKSLCSESPESANEAIVTANILWQHGQVFDVVFFDVDRNVEWPSLSSLTKRVASRVEHSDRCTMSR